MLDLEMFIQQLEAATPEKIEELIEYYRGYCLQLLSILYGEVNLNSVMDLNVLGEGVDRKQYLIRLFKKSNELDQQVNPPKNPNEFTVFAPKCKVRYKRLPSNQGGFTLEVYEPVGENNTYVWRDYKMSRIRRPANGLASEIMESFRAALKMGYTVESVNDTTEE